MSDLDSMTDEEVANDLMKLNIRLSKANQLHGVDDAVMIQAVERLRANQEIYLASYVRGLNENYGLGG